MSNLINEGILETIVEEVSTMSTGSILHELEGAMRPGMCDSWDERVALTDRDKVIDLLAMKRFEAMGGPHG